MCHLFSEYERLHIFFWVLKDFGWNILNKPVWFVGLIPTLFMSIDFAWIVANVNVSYNLLFPPLLMLMAFIYIQGMIVESAHYISQFIWVLANAIWAYGEIYYGDRDDAHPLFSKYV